MEFRIPFEQLSANNVDGSQRNNSNSQRPILRLEGDNESEIDTQGNINIDQVNQKEVNSPIGIDL